VPARDLFVSPEHALVIDGVFLPARLLVNGSTIRQVETVDSLEYFHVELEMHDILVANGSPAGWYSSIAQRFIDARSLFSSTEIDYWTRRTVPQREQDYKQAVMSPFDGEIIERAARAFELSDYQVLHPSMLFRVRSRLQKDRALERMQDVLRHERFDFSTHNGLGGLPASYVAMSVAFTEALPDTDENRQFLAALVDHVSADTEIVLVDSPPPAEIAIPRSDRVHRLETIHPNADTAIQTQVVAGARAFVGSHGGLAVAAAFCGTPALTYHSDRIPADQMERLEAAAQAGWARVTLERTHRFKRVHLPRESDPARRAR